MTLGEKISAARKSVGLTQEQLAQRLCVSRAAVAKWESGAGMPDIMNLQALANLFDVAMETLLDESLEIKVFRFREPIRLEDHRPSGRCKNAYDSAVVSRFPDAYWIRRVLLQHGLTRWQQVLDFLTFGLLDACWGIFHIREFAGMYYLVELGEQQYFVTVDEGSITAAVMPYRVRTVKEFWVDGKKYLIAGPNLVK